MPPRWAGRERVCDSGLEKAHRESSRAVPLLLLVSLREPNPPISNNKRVWVRSQKCTHAHPRLTDKRQLHISFSDSGIHNRDERTVRYCTSYDTERRDVSLAPLATSEREEREAREAREAREPHGVDSESRGGEERADRRAGVRRRVARR